MKLKNKDLNFHNFKALTKKMKKLEKAYDKAEGQALLMARIEKSALSVKKRLAEYKNEEDKKRKEEKDESIC